MVMVKEWCDDDEGWCDDCEGSVMMMWVVLMLE